MVAPGSVRLKSACSDMTDVKLYSGDDGFYLRRRSGFVPLEEGRRRPHPHRHDLPFAPDRLGLDEDRRLRGVRVRVVPVVIAIVHHHHQVGLDQELVGTHPIVPWVRPRKQRPIVVRTVLLPSGPADAKGARRKSADDADTNAGSSQLSTSASTSYSSFSSSAMLPCATF
jgi:hypothetical protein